MEVNWVTVAAQIVNFLVLVYLLKRFLYRPVISAMDRRERHISERLDEARQREQSARASEEEYQSLHESLQSERAELLENAGREAEEERKKLTERLRGEIDRQREQWQRSLEREQEEFIDEFKRRSGRSLTAILRRMLSDLAGTGLEQLLIDVFIGKLGDVDQARLTAMCAGRPVEIATGFVLEEAARCRLREMLKPVTGGGEIGFVQAPELVCGIELRADNRKIGWTVADYMNELELGMNDRLDVRDPAAGSRAGDD